MKFLDVIHAYFKGEKSETLWFILPIGLAMLTYAFLLWRGETRDFTWVV